MVKKLSEGRYRIVARVRGADGKFLHKQQTADCDKETAKALHEQFKKELRGDAMPEGSLIALKTFGEVLTFYLERKDAVRKQKRIRKLLSI